MDILGDKSTVTLDHIMVIIDCQLDSLDLSGRQMSGYKSLEISILALLRVVWNISKQKVVYERLATVEHDLSSDIHVGAQSPIWDVICIETYLKFTVITSRGWLGFTFDNIPR